MELHHMQLHPGLSIVPMPNLAFSTSKDALFINHREIWVGWTDKQMDCQTQLYFRKTVWVTFSMFLVKFL